MLCPFCKHSILGVFFDLHDGELSSVAVVLQLHSDGSFAASPKENCSYLSQ